MSDSTTFRRLLARWQNREDVAYAHPNYLFEVNRPEASPSPSASHPLTDNPFADSLNHLDVIRAIDAWSRTQGKESVTVGVVDTGFYLNHPDLAGQFRINEAEDVNNNGRLDEADFNGVDDDGNGYVDDVIGYDFVDRTTVVEDGEFEDRDPDPSADPKGRGSGHGTSVAGIVSSAPGTKGDGIAGVAPNTRLVGLRAFGGDGFGESDDIAAAIAYAAETDVDVLNLSFGRPRSVSIIRDAIEYAHEQGVVIVGSAGNTLTDDPHYPSDYPEVISVVWLAEDGEGLPNFNQSQFGIGVDIGAPGSNVFTANFPVSDVEDGVPLRKQDLYHNPSGSSFSAPQVAGAAALLRAADSSLSPASVRSILTATAEDLTEENWDHRTGAGLLNVNAALARAYPARTEIVSPDNNGGVSDREHVPVVGTSIDPAFSHYSVSYAEGTSGLDERVDPWIEIAGRTDTQVRNDTLAEWDTGALEEGEYTLRLTTTLQDGRTIEDRRRLIVDRSAPTPEVEFLADGRVRGRNGLVAAIETEDRTRLRTTVEHRGDTTQIRSQRIAQQHLVTWPDETGRGGAADVTIEATNASGLTTSFDTTIQVSPRQDNTALLRRTETSVPRGLLLPTAPDFDGDGLQELVFNQSREGGTSDTLRSFEWMGSGFAPVDTLVVSVENERTRESIGLAPRDVGDTDGDGHKELLLQVGIGTLLLEQSASSPFPSEVAYADTTGDVLRGIRLTDFDEDDKGEILGTIGREFEIVERVSADANADFQSVLQLENPTDILGRDDTLSNKFDTPNAGTGDFDNDGNQDLLAGDRDGDLLVYESTGDDAMEVAWTHETDRLDAGDQFAVGNFRDGEATSFVTMATDSLMTHYSVWASTGEDQYEPVYQLPIVGPASEGAMTAADLDGDGRDEVIISRTSSLLVLDRSSAGTWRVRHQNQEGLPLKSRQLVAADFDDSGRPSILAETVRETLVRFVVNEQSLDASPPQWAGARPGGDASAELAWTAPGADSVTVYGGSPDGPLDPIAEVPDSSYVASGSARRRYALRAWKGGARSPLSPSKTVRPHAPATITSVEYPSPSTARLTFTEALRAGLEASQFAFGAENRTPSRLVQSRDQTGVVLHFPASVSGKSGSLRWTEFRDRTGLPVGQTDIPLTFPEKTERSLFIEQATLLDESRVRLQFNEPLDGTAASEADRYDLEPRGQVASIQQSDDGSVVTLRVEGLVIGANAQESSLTVNSMRSATGNRLAEEGTTVRLTKSADDLSNVFVYPNPYRAQSHSGDLKIAGLPSSATIRIFTPDGRLVRKLSVENNQNGGTTWDLRDQRGDSVPSGVYLFRINAPEQSPVLEKAAVIQ